MVASMICCCSIDLFIIPTSLSTTSLPPHSTPLLSQRQHPLSSETSPAHRTFAVLPLSSTYASLSPIFRQSVFSLLTSDSPSKSSKFVTLAYTQQNSNFSLSSHSKYLPSINYSHTQATANTAVF